MSTGFDEWVKIKGFPSLLILMFCLPVIGGLLDVLRNAGSLQQSALANVLIVAACIVMGLLGIAAAAHAIVGHRRFSTLIRLWLGYSIAVSLSAAALNFVCKGELFVTIGLASLLPFASLMTALYAIRRVPVPRR